MIVIRNARSPILKARALAPKDVDGWLCVQVWVEGLVGSFGS